MKDELTKAMIRKLPYQERLRRYEIDKTKLLQKMRGVSAYKFSEMLKELADKWQI